MDRTVGTTLAGVLLLAATSCAVPGTGGLPAATSAAAPATATPQAAAGQPAGTLPAASQPAGTLPGARFAYPDYYAMPGQEGRTATITDVHRARAVELGVVGFTGNMGMGNAPA